MLAALASLLGRSRARPLAEDTPSVADPGEVERRRQVLRAAALGFARSGATERVRVDLERRGYEMRVDDVTPHGVSAWAPVNTWALHPRPRREVWMVHRDRPDPWLSDTHVFATMDNATLLAAALMPTRLGRRGEALMLRTEFSLVRYQADWAEAQRENAAVSRAGSVPALWAMPSLWSVPASGWLPAEDEASVASALAGLVAGMVDTLERAGPARGALAA